MKDDGKDYQPSSSGGATAQQPTRRSARQQARANRTAQPELETPAEIELETNELDEDQNELYAETNELDEDANDGSEDDVPADDIEVEPPRVVTPHTENPPRLDLRIRQGRTPGSLQDRLIRTCFGGNEAAYRRWKRKQKPRPWRTHKPRGLRKPRHKPRF
jgi:hypothetical protein